MANEKFKNAVQRIAQKTPPIWFMRQAGRYHQHYQKLRAKYSFMELCKNPELAAEVAFGPVNEFDFDVAILFSDLLFPLEAMGMGLSYDDGGPKLGWHLTAENISQLKRPDDALPALEFQKQAMLATRARIPAQKSLIGFVGGPWTLFAYAVQGSHDGGLTQAKAQLPLFEGFCAKVVELLEKNIRLQLEGGAEIVMLFDTAAGELSPALFKRHVVPQLSKLAQTFPQKLGYYSKLTTQAHLDHPLFQSGLFAGLGFDHRWALKTAVRLSKSGFVQGNFDQSLFFADTIHFKNYLADYIHAVKEFSASERAGWVCGLGHGVLPKTPEAHVKHFVDYVRSELA